MYTRNDDTKIQLPRYSNISKTLNFKIDESRYFSDNSLLHRIPIAKN